MENMKGLLPESNGQDLAVAVLYVPYSPDSGGAGGWLGHAHHGALRAKREQLERLQQLLRERQGQTLAVAVLQVPYSPTAEVEVVVRPPHGSRAT